MLTSTDKEKIIQKFKTHKDDTGSPEVQTGILSAEIEYLTNHLKQHKKDHSSRRGLLGKVASRKKLLNYLHKEDAERYAVLIKKLGIKG